MQTFLPYSDFYISVNVLDKKRCWKQVVEAKQIISVLEGKTTAWQNHPTVRMWKDYTYWLKEYFNSFLDISFNVHKINTKYDYYYQDLEIPTIKPWWLGDENFHRSHRARLIEKDEAFYLPKFPNDKGFNDGLYLWPDNDTKTFKIIKPKIMKNKSSSSIN